ncbi:MAG: 4-(cytidine 5'-diphospho)-2-C-methyl-D-erythritol kinase [Lachnospiraceae bacterium]|nr:4-(cytidine 5'-diphospho)-2-C-methyl-D-erythritol kinase [Lachnospiraceae bacterium]
MKINAYAKINLGLDVTGKRDDGYHEVRMIMQNIDLHDELVVDRTDEAGITITTDRDDLSTGEDNLIHKAAKLMMDEYGLSGGIKVHLTKNIPVAAGLAGGSTDAAATLIAVNELFGLGLSQIELMKIGVRIGADVPYCIMGGTVLAEGIGEILTPLPPCPGWRTLIAKPDVSVSTAHVYKSYRSDSVEHPDIDSIAGGIEKGDFDTVTRYMGNVLESVTASEVPYVGQIKDIIAECGGHPLMSGSGPTVFGLFESEDKINSAYDRLKQADSISDLFITRIFDGRTQTANEHG